MTQQQGIRYNLTTVFVSSLYLFDSNFSGIKQFGLISIMIVIKEFVSLTTVAIETGKKNLSYHSNSC